MRAAVAILLLGAHSLLGCSAGLSEPATPESPNSLYVAPSTIDFSQNAELRKTIAARDYNYFRFTNRLFAAEVCKRFAEELTKSPEVNLHGDAHLEQYAVTDRGRGLSDFDNATIGPPLIDIVRFGASLHLAAHHRGWEEAGSAAFAKFLDAYLGALREPSKPAPVPDLVARAHASFNTTSEQSLVQAEAWMIPVEVEGTRTQDELNRYATLLVKKHPKLTLDYFKIKKWGRLKTGIGSGLEQKYLFTVEGPSTARVDDVLIEAKLVRPLKDVPCVRSSQSEAPIRILDGQARIAYEPYRLGGYITAAYEKSGDRLTFWLHEWQRHYVELDIESALTSPTDLQQVAADVGYQLGRGHTRAIADPYEQALRAKIAAQISAGRAKLEAEVANIAQRTRDAAARYRAAIAGSP